MVGPRRLELVPRRRARDAAPSRRTQTLEFGTGWPHSRPGCFEPRGRGGELGTRLLEPRLHGLELGERRVARIRRGRGLGERRVPLGPNRVELRACALDLRVAELLLPAGDLELTTDLLDLRPGRVEVVARDHELRLERLHLLDRGGELVPRSLELGVGLLELGRAIGLILELSEVGAQIEHLGLGVRGSSRRLLVPVSELGHLSADDVEVRSGRVQLAPEVILVAAERVAFGGDRVAFGHHRVAFGRDGVTLRVQLAADGLERRDLGSEPAELGGQLRRGAAPPRGGLVGACRSFVRSGRCLVGSGLRLASRLFRALGAGVASPSRVSASLARVSACASSPRTVRSRPRAPRLVSVSDAFVRTSSSSASAEAPDSSSRCACSWSRLIAASSDRADLSSASISRAASSRTVAPAPSSASARAACSSAARTLASTSPIELSLVASASLVCASSPATRSSSPCSFASSAFDCSSAFCACSEVLVLAAQVVPAREPAGPVARGARGADGGHQREEREEPGGDRGVDPRAAGGRRLVGTDDLRHDRRPVPLAHRDGDEGVDRTVGGLGLGPVREHARDLAAEATVLGADQGGVGREDDDPVGVPDRDRLAGVEQPAFDERGDRLGAGRRLSGRRRPRW